MGTLAHRERLAICDTLLRVGPNAQTLSGSWTARDLAAHLVLRERNPAALGIAVSAFAGWTERTQRSFAARPYEVLVDQIRRGPPWWSPLRQGRVDALVNTFEYFVHHEDVRRARPDWDARALAPDAESELYAMLAKRAELFLRKSRQRVVLDADDFGRIEIGTGSVVTVKGLPSELVLYLHGRTTHSLVDIEGEPEAISQFRQLRLSV